MRWKEGEAPPDLSRIPPSEWKEALRPYPDRVRRRAATYVETHEEAQVFMVALGELRIAPNRLARLMVSRGVDAALRARSADRPSGKAGLDTCSKPSAGWRSM